MLDRRRRPECVDDEHCGTMRAHTQPAHTLDDFMMKFCFPLLRFLHLHIIIYFNVSRSNIIYFVLFAAAVAAAALFFFEFFSELRTHTHRRTKEQVVLEVALALRYLLYNSVFYSAQCRVYSMRLVLKE